MERERTRLFARGLAKCRDQVSEPAWQTQATCCPSTSNTAQGRAKGVYRASRIPYRRTHGPWAVESIGLAPWPRQDKPQSCPNESGK